MIFSSEEGNFAVLSPEDPLVKLVLFLMLTEEYTFFFHYCRRIAITFLPHFSSKTHLNLKYLYS